MSDNETRKIVWSLTTGVMYSEGSETSGESYNSLMYLGGAGLSGGDESSPVIIRPRDDPSSRVKTLFVSSNKTSSGFSWIWDDFRDTAEPHLKLKLIQNVLSLLTSLKQQQQQQQQ